MTALTAPAADHIHAAGGDIFFRNLVGGYGDVTPQKTWRSVLPRPLLRVFKSFVFFSRLVTPLMSGRETGYILHWTCLYVCMYVCM